MKRYIFWGYTIFLLCLACVPVKKINYLQDEGKYNDDYPRDSVLAVYRRQLKKYVLKPSDIISIRIGSLTPSEYNFVQQYEEQLGEIRKLRQYSQGQQDVQGQRLSQNMGGVRGDQEGGMSAITLDRLNTGFVLDEKGELPFPKIGNLQLSGLTIAEAQEVIEEKLLGFFETPEVRIQLLSFQFTIVGEVENQGRYTTFKPESNIFDIITMAGNLTDFADRSRIKIVREYPDGMADVRYINTLDEGLLANVNYFIQPDDMIIVPALKARTWRKYTIPLSATTLGLITAAVSLILLISTINR